METSAALMYLRDVLGVENVFLESETASALALEGSGPLFFLGDGALSDPAKKELLHKMITAMGYSPQNVFVCDLKPDSEDLDLNAVLTQFSPKAVVVLGRELKAALGGRAFETNSIFVTHSLGDLLARPELKKETWADLKKVMNFINERKA